MSEKKEVILPSGAKLRLFLAPFSEAKNLYKKIAKTAQLAKYTPGEDGSVDVNFLKDLLLSVLSSDEIEEALKPVMACSLYNDLKITDDLFESEKARGDYFKVLLEVGEFNLFPFLKPHLQGFKTLQDSIQKLQKPS